MDKQKALDKWLGNNGDETFERDFCAGWDAAMESLEDKHIIKNYEELKTFWLDHHKDAHNIIFRKEDQEPFAAIYFIKSSPAYTQLEADTFLAKIHGIISGGVK